MQLDARAVVYFLLKRAALWVFFSAWLALMFGPGINATEPHPGIQWDTIFGLILRIVPILALVLGLDGIYCYLKARSYRFDLGPQGVALETGILSKSHETLLYGKIQDILIQRSVLQRLLDLSTVVIQNAMGQPATIPALRAATAAAFRDEVLRRVPR
jgi:membrane protein YdbS with pleckstrin-like domain